MNGGKGSAVRQGIAMATGDLLIIQDADLEYDPNDYVPMLQALSRAGAMSLRQPLPGARPAPEPVAGRLPRRPEPERRGPARTGRFLTDTVTAYKLFRRADLAALPLRTSGFELDHQITARILARG